MSVARTRPTPSPYVNIAWPRAEGVPWYQDWAVVLMSGIVLALGVVVYLTIRSKLEAAEDRLEDDPDAIHWGTPADSETSV